MDAVNMQIDKRGIDILRNKDDEWLRIFRFSTDRRFRTHIHPLNAPGTELPITRFRPSDHPWQYGLFVSSPYDIVDGKATVTDAPGWGVEIACAGRETDGACGKPGLR